MWGDGVSGGDGSLLAAGLDLANESDMPRNITGLFPADPLSSLLPMARPPRAPAACHIVSPHMRVLVVWWSLQLDQQHSWEGASQCGGEW